MIDGWGREPRRNGLAPAVVLAASIVGLYRWQAGSRDEDALVVDFGLAPFNVAQGDYVGLVTYMLLHGSWLHAGANAVFALLAGYWVARRLGPWALGLVSLVLFYLVSGVFAGMAYIFLHPGSQTLLIGASGAVSALIGAATRLAFSDGVLRPVLSRTVVSVSAAWVAVNFLIASGASDPTSGAMPVAWEAHVAGFFVGLLLIGPWAALFSRRPEDDGERAAAVTPYEEMQVASDADAPSEPTGAELVPSPGADAKAGHDRVI